MLLPCLALTTMALATFSGRRGRCEGYGSLFGPPGEREIALATATRESAQRGWDKTLEWFRENRGYRLLRHHPKTPAMRHKSGVIWVGSPDKGARRKMAWAVPELIFDTEAEFEEYQPRDLNPDDRGVYWSKFMFYPLMA